MVDGQDHLLQKKDSEVYYNQDNYTSDAAFEVFKSNLLSYGLHSFELSLANDRELRQSNYSSKARIEIKRISFVGVENGVQTECLETPDGYYSLQGYSEPRECQPGFEPNDDKSGCTICPE